MASAESGQDLRAAPAGHDQPGLQADLLLANNKFETQMTIIDGIIKYRRSAR
jgi:N-acetylglucosamine-6-phosphate deacetylase